jgi:hypothetical protein
LEKIYELCDKCKSRVKFEITRQDGALKHYLFQQGQFSFLYEPHQNIYENKFKRAAIPDNETCPQPPANHSAASFPSQPVTSFPPPPLFAKIATHLFDLIRSLTRVLAYFLVLVFTLITSMYNFKESTPAPLWLSNGNTSFLIVNVLRYKSQFYEANNEALKAAVDSFLVDNTAFFKSIGTGDSTEVALNETTSFSYFNSQLSYNLIFIYCLASLLLLTSSRLRKSVSFRLDLFLWIISLLMLIVNYRKCLNAFKLDDPFDTAISSSRSQDLLTATALKLGPVSLDFVPAFTQLVLIVLLLKLGTLVFSCFFISNKNQNRVSEQEECLNNKTETKTLISDGFISPPNLPRAFNCNSFPTVSASSTNVIRKPAKSVIMTNNAGDSTLIKPARFLPTSNGARSLFQFKTLKNGSASLLNGTSYTFSMK